MTESGRPKTGGAAPGRARTDGGTSERAGTGRADAQRATADGAHEAGGGRRDGNWRRIARQEASLLLDSQSAQHLHLLLVGAVLLAAYIYPMVGPEPYTTAHFPGFVLGALTTLVPLVGVLVGYNAVASDRESGALRLSLSLPLSRREVVLGAFVGRFGVLAAYLLAGLVAAGALVVYPFGDLELLPFLGFVLATLAFGAIWTGLGVAASLSVATKQRALALAVGLFFLFVVLWDALPTTAQFALDAVGLLDGELPEPVLFVVDLSPGNAFQRVTAGFVNPGASVDGPWYRGRWVALGTFLLWIVAPLGLATRRFERSDLS